MSQLEKETAKKTDCRSDLDEFAVTMTKGVRRWEKVIYPMMIAFIILAGYGFWLIYNVTQDMHKMTLHTGTMAEAVVSMAATVNIKLHTIDKHMEEMNENIASVKNLDLHLSSISSSVSTMTKSLISMDQTITQMHHSVYSMGHSTHAMSGNLAELNHNISAPLNTMNSMIPWSVMPNTQRPQSQGFPFFQQPFLVPIPQR